MDGETGEERQTKNQMDEIYICCHSQRIMIVLMIVTAAGGCKDSDIKLPWVSLKIWGKKGWANFLPPSATKWKK